VGLGRSIRQDPLSSLTGSGATRLAARRPGNAEATWRSGNAEAPRRSGRRQRAAQKTALHRPSRHPLSLLRERGGDGMGGAHLSARGRRGSAGRTAASDVALTRFLGVEIVILADKY
jgi:hypothetical protein